jgi:hypothetical protein
MIRPRTLIGDHFGRVLAEVNPTMSTLQWKLNDVSKVNLTISRTDPQVVEYNFLPGNRIFIEPGNGLPPWGGILDPPETWTVDELKTTAYSGEEVLRHRQTDRGRYFLDASPGFIFRSVITEALDRAPMNLAIGTVENVKSQHSPEYHLKDLLYICQNSLVRIADTDFWVQPTLDDGKINFTAHLYAYRGVERPNVVFIDGHNVADLKLKRQGPIVNSWDTAGSGTGWGDTDRAYSHREDAASIARYGLRQGSSIHADILLQGTLDETTDFLLDETKDPRNRWSMTVTDTKPAAFEDYDIGDVCRLIAPDFGWNGFDGYVRVLSRNYDPRDDKCALVVEDTELSQVQEA